MSAFANHHDLLIRAVLSEDVDEGAEAYRSWRAQVDVERLDGSQLRLLPMLVGRLAEQAADDPVAERLRRVARFTWLSGQLLISRSLPALRALQGVGVPVVLIRGAAIHHYGRVNAGVRPIDDLDVLVPLDRAPEAAAALAGLGLRSLSPLSGPEDPILDLQHSLNFWDGHGAQVDLHWHLLHCSRHPAADDGFISRARPGRLRDLDCLVLSPEDTLINVIEHGCRWAIPPALRWATDAATLLRSCTLDWDLVVGIARDHRLAVEVGVALDYLVEAAGAPVPEAARRDLHRARQTAAQRHRRARGPDPEDGGPRLPGRYGRALESWDEYAARSIPPGRHARVADPVRWLRSMWLLDREAAVPAAAVFVGLGRPWPLRRLLGGHRRAGRRHPGLPPYLPGADLSFGRGGSGNVYAVAGWDVEEEHGRWTRGGLGRVVLPLPDGGEGRWLLEADCVPLLSARRPEAEVEVVVHGRRIATWRFAFEPEPDWERSAELRAPGAGPVEVLFRVRYPEIPTIARVPGSDDRQLGLLLSRLRLGPGEAERRPAGCR